MHKDVVLIYIGFTTSDIHVLQILKKVRFSCVFFKLIKKCYFVDSLSNYFNRMQYIQASKPHIQSPHQNNLVQFNNSPPGPFLHTFQHFPSVGKILPSLYIYLYMKITFLILLQIIVYHKCYLIDVFIQKMKYTISFFV